MAPKNDKEHVVGILGGLALYEPDFMDTWEPVIVKTPYGTPQYIYKGTLDGVNVIYARRWFRDQEFRPPTALYEMQRAVIYAFKELGVSQIIIHDGAGSINRAYELGDFLLVGDFIDFTSKFKQSYYTEMDSLCVNIPFNTPFCLETNQVAAAAAKKLGIPLFDCVMAITEGPRFETPAEIRMFDRVGCDAVCQGILPEIVFARELGMCYTAIFTVCNYASGVKRLGDWTIEEWNNVEYQIMPKVQSLICEIIRELPAERSCNCANYLEENTFKVEISRRNGLMKQGLEEWPKTD